MHYGGFFNDGPTTKINLTDKASRRTLIRNLEDFRAFNTDEVKNDSIEIATANLQARKTNSTGSIDQLIQGKISGYNDDRNKISALLSYLNFYNQYFSSRYSNFPKIELFHSLTKYCNQTGITVKHIQAEDLNHEHIAHLDLELLETLKKISREYTANPNLENLTRLNERVKNLADEETSCSYRKQALTMLAEDLRQLAENRTVLEHCKGHVGQGFTPLAVQQVTPKIAKLEGRIQYLFAPLTVNKRTNTSWTGSLAQAALIGMTILLTPRPIASEPELLDLSRTSIVSPADQTKTNPPQTKSASQAGKDGQILNNADTSTAGASNQPGQGKLDIAMAKRSSLMDESNKLDTLQHGVGGQQDIVIAEVLENTTGESFFSTHSERYQGDESIKLISNNNNAEIIGNRHFTVKIELRNIKSNDTYYLPIPPNCQISSLTMTPNCKYELKANRLKFPEGIDQVTITYKGNTLKNNSPQNSYTNFTRSPLTPMGLEFVNEDQTLLRRIFGESTDMGALQKYMSGFDYVTSNDIAEIISKLPGEMHFNTGLLGFGDCNMFSEYLSWLLQDITPCASSYGFIDEEGVLKAGHAKFRFANNQGELVDFETTSYVAHAYKNVKLSEADKQYFQGFVERINQAESREERVRLIRVLGDELRGAIKRSRSDPSPSQSIELKSNQDKPRNDSTKLDNELAQLLLAMLPGVLGAGAVAAGAYGVQKLRTVIFMRRLRSRVDKFSEQYLKSTNSKLTKPELQRAKAALHRMMGHAIEELGSPALYVKTYKPLHDAARFLVPFYGEVRTRLFLRDVKNACFDDKGFNTKKLTEVIRRHFGIKTHAKTDIQESAKSATATAYKTSIDFFNRLPRVKANGCIHEIDRNRLAEVELADVSDVRRIRHNVTASNSQSVVIMQYVPSIETKGGKEIDFAIALDQIGYQQSAQKSFNELMLHLFSFTKGNQFRPGKVNLYCLGELILTMPIPSNISDKNVRAVAESIIRKTLKEREEIRLNKGFQNHYANLYGRQTMFREVAANPEAKGRRIAALRQGRLMIAYQLSQGSFAQFDRLTRFMISDFDRKQIPKVYQLLKSNDKFTACLND